MIEVLLGLAVLLLATGLFMQTRLVKVLGDEKSAEEHRVHAKCIAAVAHYVGSEHASAVLRQAALDYDSPAGQQRLKVIAHSSPSWNAEHSSIPATWLTQIADQL